MKSVPELNSITYSNQIIADRGVYGNNYFIALQSGEMNLEQFQRTQEQFYFAVHFFSRPMTALLARFPDPQTRLSILENVVEEHGGFQEKAFHETTFRKFLISIGVNDERLSSVGLWPEVRAFNSTLMTPCIFDEPEVGVACLGVIEYMFAEISTIIGRSVVGRGWCLEESLVHYKLHSAIDKRHAREFFEIVDHNWSDESKRYFIEQGIEMGVYIFDRLYRDLYETAKRETSKEVFA
jgi:pyrroloquinoline-quinone synthase